MSTPDDLATAAQDLVAAVAAASVDPADALRLLDSLARFTPALPTTQSQIGQAMAAMQDTTGDLFRRAAVAQLARAATAYQPSSYDDAIRVRDLVCARIDAETTIAGDRGEDDVYAALRQLRQAVVQDLMARGASLAPIARFDAAAPQPADVLATRLYRDPTRAAALVKQADPVHPLFMPTSFRALSR
jgi:prophage DNA circulation protein